jgi:hypothetical protein
MADDRHPAALSDDELFRDLNALRFNNHQPRLLKDGSPFWVKVHARGETPPAVLTAGLLEFAARPTGRNILRFATRL